MQNKTNFVVYRMFDSEGQAIAKLLSDSNRTNHRAQALSTGMIHLLDDGRAVEVSWDSRGCWLYGVHSSLDDALAYKSKQYDSVRLEQW
jgi:hypothetical protein